MPISPVKTRKLTSRARCIRIYLHCNMPTWLDLCHRIFATSPWLDLYRRLHYITLPLLAEFYSPPMVLYRRLQVLISPGGSRGGSLFGTLLGGFVLTAIENVRTSTNPTPRRVAYANIELHGDASSACPSDLLMRIRTCAITCPEIGE